MIPLIFLTLLAYLLGSISGSIVMGKLKKVDIRQMGSGNAGGTNAFRTQGLLFALPVVIIDIGKGFIATQYFSEITLFGPTTIEFSNLIIGSASIIGHCYPIFHNFQGGKGAGTAMGVLISVFPNSILPAIIIWILSLIFTGFVGLSTILAGITVSITSFLQLQNLPLQMMCLFLSMFIIFMHRSNIIRMIKGEENQFKKIMIFKK